MEHTHRVSTDEIIAMYNNGMSQTDIARATGMSQATVDTACAAQGSW